MRSQIRPCRSCDITTRRSPTVTTCVTVGAGTCEGSACPLRYEREKPPRVVDHDSLQRRIVGARGFQLRQERRDGPRIAARRVAGDQHVVGEAGVEQRDHERHDVGVAVSALAVEADESAAAADRLVHVDVRVVQVAEVADANVRRVDARVLEYVQLLDRRLSRDARVREDR